MEEKDKDTTKNVLQRGYKFWFSKSKLDKRNMSKEDFENELIDLKAFSSVEEFWGLYLHMKKPSQFDTGAKFFLFQEGIRPLWEDEKNKNGGRFYIRVKKDKADKIWEDLILGYIGEAFEFNHEICGLQLASRPEDVIVISIWTQPIKHFVKDEFCKWLRDWLNIPMRVRIEYQDHPNKNDGYKKNWGGNRRYNKY